jgi:hypothetical protein
MNKERYNKREGNYLEKHRDHIQKCLLLQLIPIEEEVIEVNAVVIEWVREKLLYISQQICSFEVLMDGFHDCGYLKMNEVVYWKRFQN